MNELDDDTRQPVVSEDANARPAARREVTGRAHIPASAP